MWIVDQNEVRFSQSTVLICFDGLDEPNLQSFSLDLMKLAD